MAKCLLLSLHFSGLDEPIVHFPSLNLHRKRGFIFPGIRTLSIKIRPFSTTEVEGRSSGKRGMNHKGSYHR